MVKKKLIVLTLSGAIFLMGSGSAFADNTVNTPIPTDTMPISAPINDEDATKPIESKFSDIQNHWAFKEIVLLENRGIWGDLSGEFQPKQIVTGADFAAYLDKIFEFETEPDFAFKHNSEVSRMEAAKAIEKSFAAKNISVFMTLIFPVYDDTTNLGPEETSALSFVFNTGIMKGKSKSKFLPDDSITKGELAVILQRTLTTIENAVSK
ncbi:MAG: S-layer homology domain-containing protein [Bacillota bacterium]|jgi:hypothetical protein